jgi:predicted aspartyl protease
LSSGYLVIVEGSIGLFGHLKFILDTGTTRTCIDRGLARQLALPLEVHSVFRFDKQVRLNSTHLASLTLGPLQAENFSVNVADLSRVGISHAPIDAIIGLDILESFPFQIDYEQMRVTFGAIPSLAESASMDAIPLLPVVSLDFNGFKSLLLIDTGAIKTVLFSEKLRGPSYGWRFLGTETWADSLGGITKARKVVIQGAAISSGRGFQEVYVIHAPLHDPLPMVNGILSPVAFGIRQIGFDFDRHIVTWTR